MKKLLFLINPVSGKTEGQKVTERIHSILSRYLSRNQYDIVFTEPDIKDQLAGISPHYETLVVAGGDGTLSNLVHAMVTLGRKHKIGMIPLGTGNDFARSLGLMTAEGLETHVNTVLKGNAKQVDVLEVNNRYTCINYFGMGNDAGILSDFEEIRKDVSNQYLFRMGMGKLVYAFAGARHLNDKIPPGAAISCRSHNNEEIQLNLNSEIRAILISNITSYGGGTSPSSMAQTDDGLFEVTVIKNIKEWAFLHLARFTGKPANIICPGIKQFQTDRAEVLLPEETFCQVDGEIIEGLSEKAKKFTIRIKSQVDMIVP